MANLSNLLPPGNILTSRVFEYADRAQLRSYIPLASEQATARVKGLGIFFWYPGSTDIDDGESCFAATGGRWILEAINWDFVDAQMPPVPKIRRENFPNTITTISANSSVTILVNLIGATTQSTIIVNPPGSLPTACSVSAYCSTDDQIVIVLTNSSASSGQPIPAGNWTVTAIE